MFQILCNIPKMLRIHDIMKRPVLVFIPSSCLDEINKYLSWKQPAFEIKYSRMDQVKVFKVCLTQTLLSPFFNTLSHFIQHCVKYVRIWVFSNLHFPEDSCGFEKALILVYFKQGRTHWFRITAVNFKKSVGGALKNITFHASISGVLYLNTQEMDLKFMKIGQVLLLTSLLMIGI